MEDMIQSESENERHDADKDSKQFNLEPIWNCYLSASASYLLLLQKSPGQLGPTTKIFGPYETTGYNLF